MPLMTAGMLKLADYAYYSALALGAGIPLNSLPTIRNAANLVYALPFLEINGPLRIVDVGAHRGDWGMVCARLFSRGQILSFEPIREFCEQAKRRAAKFENWRVMRVALGKDPGEGTMQVRGQRSSFVPVGGDEFPEWSAGNEEVAGQEKVPIDMLDRILAERDFLPVDLLKIDAEGYELEILQGAKETLKQTRMVLIEVRFHELFVGGATFLDVHPILTKCGFCLQSLKPCKGQCLWADALYLKAGRQN